MLWTRVLVIGAGGTGSLLFQNLVRYLRSIEFQGLVIIADGDSYSTSNSERQNFSSDAVGRNKAEYQAELAAATMPDFADQISFADKYLSKEDIDEFVVEGTVVINCVDNVAARKYVEDRIDSLSTGAHICSGNELRDGQVQISHRMMGRRITPTVYVRSPGFNSESEDRSKMTCQEIAALPGGAQMIGTNMTAAAICLNYVIELMGNQKANKNGEWIPNSFVVFDIVTNAFKSMEV